MAEFILLMHNDAEGPEGGRSWATYLDHLGSVGALRGGSAIGNGLCLRRDKVSSDITSHLVGYIKIAARDMDHAQKLVANNPVYMAGGTVEIRELPRSD